MVDITSDAFTMLARRDGLFTVFYLGLVLCRNLRPIAFWDLIMSMV